MIKFSNEMLIPTANGELYYSIYELENWIRRICLCTYIISFGDNWHKEVPNKILEKLKRQIRKNMDLKYLGAESDNNFIWSATLGELVILFQNENISSRLEDIIGYNKDRFILKVDELREVRNLLAHNRALSKSSEIIINGIVESLRLAVKNFKNIILYNSDYEICFGDSDDEVMQYFNDKMKGNDWSKFQAFISKADYLYSIVCLPDGEFNKYPSAAKLLNTYKEHNENILSFLINKACDEFSILLSNKIGISEIKKIIDVFLEKPNIWTSKYFEQQDPRYVCNPKIWFYENEAPLEE